MAFAPSLERSYSALDLEDKSKGFPTALFVDQSVLERYSCSLCKRVPRECVEVSCPSHDDLDILTFCEVCIKRHSDKTGGKCPINDHSEVSWRPSGFVRKDVMRSKVRCVNAVKASAKLRDKQRLAPDFMDDCFLEEGAYTGEGYGAAAAAAEAAVPGEAVAGDEAMCTWVGPLGRLERHLAEECVMQSGKCAFHKLGCETAVTGATVKGHERECVVKHVAMLRTAFVSSKEAVDTMKQTVRDMKSNVDESLSQLAAENDELKLEMETLSGQSQEMAKRVAEAMAELESLKSTTGSASPGGGVFVSKTSSVGQRMPSSVIKATPIVVSRGAICRTEDSRWNHRGGLDKRDAVAFECTKAFVLRGVGVLSGRGRTAVHVKVCKGENLQTGTRYIAQSAETVLTTTAKASDPVEVQLETLLICEPNVRYTVEVHQTNAEGERSRFVKDCSTSTFCENGFSFRWINAGFSPNGTDTDEGAVPTLYIVALETLYGGPLPTSSASTSTSSAPTSAGSTARRSSPLLSAATAFSTDSAAVTGSSQFGGSRVPSYLREAIATVVTRGTVEESSTRWNHRGTVDALQFEVDQSVIVRGVGVLPPAGKCRVQVRVIRGRNSEAATGSSSFVAQSAFVEIARFAKSQLPVEVMFEDVFVAETGRTYTIEVVQTNSDGKVSCFAEHCPMRSTQGPFTVRWSNAEHSPNGTDTDEGCVPCLYLLSLAALSGASGSSSHSATTSSPTSSALSSTFGEEFTVRRGDFDSASWRWNYTGTCSALGMTVDSGCVLTAVGVFPGAEATTVRVRVLEGDNAADIGWTDARIVAKCDEMYFVESSTPSLPKMCRLSSPAILKAKRLYTLEIYQTNSGSQKSYFAQSGKRTICANGVTITFSNATHSPNGTDVDEGAFPTVSLAKLL